MKDEGMYLQLWKKYLPVIRLLLKKTDAGQQKLKLYRHEFEVAGNKNKSGYTFSIEIVNGKVANKTNKTAVGRDLVQVMNENEVVANWLKDQSVKISVGKSFELNLEKIQGLGT